MAVAVFVGVAVGVLVGVGTHASTNSVGGLPEHVPFSELPHATYIVWSPAAGAPGLLNSILIPVYPFGSTFVATLSRGQE